MEAKTYGLRNRHSGQTQNLLHDFFGLTVSRAGLLGHLHWGGQLFAPVVEERFFRFKVRGLGFLTVLS